MEDEWWTSQAQNLHLADNKDLLGFSDGLKTIYGPLKCNLVPVRSQDGDLLKDKSAILNHWAQHFQILLNHKNPTIPNILDEIPPTPPSNQIG